MPVDFRRERAWWDAKAPNEEVDLLDEAFLPGELRALLEGAGMRVLRCGGLGTLASLCGMGAVEALRADADAYAAFLDLCERYDLEVLPDGPGTWRRAGLIAVAEPA